MKFLTIKELVNKKYENITDEEITNVIESVKKLSKDSRYIYFYFMNLELIYAETIKDSDPMELILKYKTPNIEKLTSEIREEFLEDLIEFVERDNVEDESSEDYYFGLDIAKKLKALRSEKK